MSGLEVLPDFVWFLMVTGLAIFVSFLFADWMNWL